MDLAAKIRNQREAKGWTVMDLSRASGVSQPYLQQLEAGRRKNPTGAVLQKLAAALGTTVGELLGLPLEVSEEKTKSLPKSLRQLIKEKGKALDIREEDIEMLRRLHYRGKQPSRMEDWELIFCFLRRMLE